MIELTTERLVLRLPDPELAPVISRYYLDNAAHFAPYCPRRPEGFHSAEQWRIRAADLRSASLEGRALHFHLFRRDDAQRIVGDVNVTNIMRGAFEAAYLGYQLDREVVGEGLMTEALRATIRYCFDELRLHRLMANYVPTNERSARVLRRLGFVVEGYARDYLLLDGRWKDHILTSRTEPEAPRPVNAYRGESGDT